jgi:hypothetical protein
VDDLFAGPADEADLTLCNESGGGMTVAASV